MMALANILAPVGIITLIGYAFGRSSVGLHFRTLGTLVLMVATPSLIFHTLVSMHVGPETLGRVALAAICAIGVSTALGLIVLRATGAPLRTYLPSIMFPNSGNLGLPLALLTFGDDGMRLGISYFFMVSTLQHSVGFSISAGGMDFRHLLRQPILYAVSLVLIISLLDLPVPEVVMTTTEMLGGMMIPTMLILLGGSLATLKIADSRPAVGVAIARLVIGFASALTAIWFLELEGALAGTVFLLATMPTAVVTYIYAERYSEDGASVAGAVVVSTVLTFLCLPALIWVALWIAEHGL